MNYEYIGSGIVRITSQAKTEAEMFYVSRPMCSATPLELNFSVRDLTPESFYGWMFSRFKSIAVQINTLLLSYIPPLEAYQTITLRGSSYGS